MKNIARLERFVYSFFSLVIILIIVKSFFKENVFYQGLVDYLILTIQPLSSQNWCGGDNTIPYTGIVISILLGISSQMIKHFLPPSITVDYICLALNTLGGLIFLSSLIRCLPLL